MSSTPQRPLTALLRAPHHGTPLWAHVGARATTPGDGTLRAALTASTSPRRPELACSTSIVTIVY
jgi:hypothetical protein